MDGQGHFSLSQAVPSNLALGTDDFPGAHFRDVTLELQLQDNGNGGYFFIPPPWNLAFFFFFTVGKKIILKSAASFFESGE